MDKDKRGKHTKASRINWYATDSNYKQLNKAAKKHTSRKKKDKTLTIKSFCLSDGTAKGIHHSVMQRYFDNDCWRERSGQGRPYNCDTLLNKISMGITQERLETHSVISSVMKWFRFESEKRFNENKRRKREACVCTGDVFNPDEPWQGLPPKLDLLNFSVIHFVICNKKHFIYVRADRFEVRYTDSAMYQDNLRSNSKKTSQLIMEKVVEKIQGISEGMYFLATNYAEIKDGPKQSNDKDCGVFAIFFVDCSRSGFTIKPRLSDQGIQNHR